MNELIDTHCHLNDPAFNDTIDDVLERARQMGVVGCIVPSYDRGSLARTQELARLYPGMIFPGFGIHPWFLDEGALRDVKNYLKMPETVCVGEVGLDLSPNMPAGESQESFFTAQLEMAAHHSLPLTVHCRKAHERVYELVKPFEGRVTVVMHSFSGSVEMMQRFLDLGCYIAFSGSVTRKTAKKYHRCAAVVPLKRLLVETDAPSIATQTTVASRVEPAHCAEIALKIAEIRGIPYGEVCRHSTSNALHVFGIR
jgi:TatD DNase family protein